MAQRLDWDRDGRDWPHRETSRFVEAAGLRWHVQDFASTAGRAAPVIVLIHGTGASTHSWRGLAPLLAHRARVIAFDLPGHAFTAMPPDGVRSLQLSLAGMAAALHTLLQALSVDPALVIGHSAGAAIAVRMCLDRRIAPQLIVSLNGALLPLGGVAGQLFSPVAKLMAATPGVPQFFSRRASDPSVVQRLVAGTGSSLDATGLSLYGMLVGNPGHAAGALGMMANWDLPGLARELPRLATPLALIVGANDRTISPRQAARVWSHLAPAAQLPLDCLPDLGHLAHEERPDLIADRVWQRYAPLAGATPSDAA